MEKRDLHSPDLAARNVEKIAALFPSVITEAADADGNIVRSVDFDLLRQELSDHIVEGPQERYRLDWPGKRAAAFAANAPIAKTLRPMREESVDFDTTKNLFIEGDNLDALKLLQESYLGKVKLIYIDPPYNTGHDLVYEDDFAETSEDYLHRSEQVAAAGERLSANTESNGRFHSNWLTMMYSRLRLARNFLSDDGVLIVAIDDHEHANLRSILDQVFGAENFLANVVWQGSGKNDARFTSGGLDYMLVYARSKVFLVERDLRFKSPKRGYEMVIAAAEKIWLASEGNAHHATEAFRRWWRTQPDVEPGLSAYNEIDDHGNVFTRDNLRSPNPRPNLMYDLIHPRSGFAVKRHPNGWTYSEDRMRQLVAEGKILFGEDHSTTPRLKRLLSDMRTQAIRPLVLKDRAPASDALTRLLGGKYFDYPKDVGVLAAWIDAVTAGDQEALILDFFAGSASLAQAVMQLNEADGGRRRFIVVQIDEFLAAGGRLNAGDFSTISELARERIRLAGRLLAGDSLGEIVDFDFGFRALRVDDGSFLGTSITPEEYLQFSLHEAVNNIKPERSGEDLLFQVLIDWGLELSLPIEQIDVGKSEVLIVDNGALAACFDASVTPEAVRRIAELQPLRAVFRDSGFVTDAARINAEQVFRELSPATEVRTI